ncbi:MAG: grasp-with-spasm system ATP-grasp peptide maturase [Bacteroidia bacterium]
MIFILNEAREGNVPPVLEWLVHAEVPFTVLNSDMPFEEIDLEIGKAGTKGALVFGSKRIELDEVQACWYRRGDMLLADEVDEQSMNFVDTHYNPEWSCLTRFLTKKLMQVPTIADPALSDLDKLTMLDAAQQAGLTVSKSYVVSSKKRLLDLLDQHPNMITKGIADSIDLADGDTYWGASTEVIDREKVQLMPERFFPSLVQPYVEKQVELRVFYLCEKMWAMAIFSQNDPQTCLDYRNYNFDRPNRNVPFALPQDIQDKVISMMDLLGMNTGSLDFILTPNNEFVFLEVNPDGQYGWLSENCNYYLEKAIADNLIYAHEKD